MTDQSDKLSAFFVFVESVAQAIGPEFFLPLAVLVLSFLLSKITRLPFWLTASATSLPLLLIPEKLPLSETVMEQYPGTVGIAVWAVGAAIVAGLGAGRFLKKLFSIGSGVLSVVFFSGFLLSLAVLTVLQVQPGLLDSQFPGWRGAFGLTLLSILLFGVAVSGLKLFRSGIIFAAWSALCIGIGCELFLDGLPPALLRDDLVALRELVPSRTLQSFLHAQEEEGAGDNTLRVLLLHGDDNDSGQLLAESLEEHLRHGSGNDQVLTVTRAGGSQMSIAQYVELVERNISKWQPDVVLFGEWLSDQEKGQNSFGIPGLSEDEAREYVDERESLSAQQSYAAFYASRLAHWAFGLSRADALPEPSDKRRVEPDRFGEYVGVLSRRIQQNGALPVFFQRPVAPGVLPPVAGKYRAAFEEAADATDALWVDTLKSFASHSHEILFTHEKQLSSRGVELLAGSLATVLREKVKSGLVEYAYLGADQRERFETLRQPQREYQMVVGSDEAGDSYQVELAVNNESEQFYRVLVGIDNRHVTTRRLKDDGPVQLDLTVPDRVEQEPFHLMQIKVVPDLSVARYPKIAESKFSFPGTLELLADEEECVLSLNGKQQARIGKEGWVAAELDFQFGSAIETVVFPGTAEGSALLARKIRKLPWGRGIGILKCGDFQVGVTERERLRAAFDYLGAPAVSNWRRIALVGIAGLELRPSAIVRSGSSRAEIRLAPTHDVEGPTFYPQLARNRTRGIQADMTHSG